MKLISLVAIILSNVSFLCAQNIVQIADNLYNEGELENIIKLKQHLSVDSCRTSLAYKIAETYSLLQQRDSAFYYLDIALEFDSTTSVLSDPDFHYLSLDLRWAEIEYNQISKTEIKNGKFPNIGLSRKLWKMKMLDQAFYHHFNLSNKELGFSHPITKAIAYIIKKNQKTNTLDLISIIDEYGWPRLSIVKESASLGAFLIMQHSDLKIQKQYLDVIVSAVDEEEASWAHLAYLIDRINLREGKKQIYGTQVKLTKNGLFDLESVLEPNKINERRKKIGLQTLEEYLKVVGIKIK